MRIKFYERDVFVAVVSAGKPDSIGRWASRGLTRASWFVPRDEWTAYRRQIAHLKTAVNFPLRHGSSQTNAIAQNNALATAFHEQLPCLLLDDDPMLAYIVKNQRSEQVAYPVLLNLLVARHFLQGEVVTYANRNTNPLWITGSLSHKPKFSTGITIINPTPVRFDENLIIETDVDFGLSIYFHHGSFPMRCEDLVAEMEMGHKGDKSQSQFQRTPEEWKRTHDYLLRKWGEWVIEKPRTGNRWKVEPHARSGAKKETLT
jgi:hypothetical protein